MVYCLQVLGGRSLFKAFGSVLQGGYEKRERWGSLFCYVRLIGLNQ